MCVRLVFLGHGLEGRGFKVLFYGGVVRWWEGTKVVVGLGKGCGGSLLCYVYLVPRLATDQT